MSDRLVSRLYRRGGKKAMIEKIEQELLAEAQTSEP